MAKVAILALALALVLFVSAQSVIGAESPSIYEQIDKDKETSAGNAAATSGEGTFKSSGSPPKEADSSSQSWTSWVEDKIEGLISGASQSSEATGAGPAQAPASANAPTA